MPRYKLIRELGRGAMGVVYEAHDAVLERSVALKLLQKSTDEPGSEFRRFEREVRACQQLRHPHIIRIYDAGVIEGQPFFTMELVEAVSLESLIEREAPLEPARAVAMVCDLLEALAYCHAQGLLHRDLKPANVMVRPGDDVVLMDFGLVKLQNATLLTAEGNAIGTPRYMAPELVRGGEASEATDVWAAGIVLYEMLAGRRPFVAVSLSEMIRAILELEPGPPSALSSQRVKPELDALVLSFLRKAPEERVPSAEEGRARLAAWLEENAAGEVEPGLAREVPSPLVSTLTETVGPAGFGRGHAVALGVGVLVAVALVAGLRSARSGRQPEAAATASATEAASVRVAPEVRSLSVSPGASQVVVQFDTAPSATLELVVEGAGAPPSVSRSDPGSQVRRVRITGLAPESRYTLSVRAPDGDVLRSQEFVTRPIRHAGEVLVRAMRALSPYALERAFTNHYFDAGLAAWRDPAKRPQAEATARGFTHRIVDAYRRADIADAAEDFAALKDRVYASSAIPAAEKREIYAQVQELWRLEDALRRARAEPVPLAARLESAEHGPVPGPRAPMSRGLAIVKEPNPEKFRTESRAGPGMVSLKSAAHERFKTTADMRDSKQRQSVIGRFSNAEEEFQDPIALPAPQPAGRLELRACLEGNSCPGGVNLYVADGAGAEPTWSLLAVLRPTTRERHVVCHALPAGILGPGPIRLKLQLGFSPLSYLETGNPNQEVRIKWVTLGWPDGP